MKKIVMAAAAAVMALGAQAEITYKMLHGYNEGALDTTSYSLYARAAEDKFLGEKIEMSKTAIEDYFASAVANGTWEDAKTKWQTYQPGSVTTTGPHPFAIKAVVDQGTALTFDRKSSEEQFNYWAVVFYQNGDTEAYRVIQATNPKGKANIITEGDKGTWGEWHTVPEPTSAMLMLLGVAGLALKRKRA